MALLKHLIRLQVSPHGRWQPSGRALVCSPSGLHPWNRLYRGTPWPVETVPLNLPVVQRLRIYLAAVLPTMRLLTQTIE